MSKPKVIRQGKLDDGSSESSNSIYIQDEDLELKPEDYDLFPLSVSDAYSSSTSHNEPYKQQNMFQQANPAETNASHNAPTPYVITYDEDLNKDYLDYPQQNKFEPTPFGTLDSGMSEQHTELKTKLAKKDMPTLFKPNLDIKKQTVIGINMYNKSMNKSPDEPAKEPLELLRLSQSGQPADESSPRSEASSEESKQLSLQWKKSAEESIQSTIVLPVL
uniref:Uncharacterized protein n=1 Tax=Ditylenchus dipsaci TaxID=166011 RepID=A0A915E1F4_9BILA